jgi:integrase
MTMPVARNERQHYASRAERLQIARACKDMHARALIRLGFYSGMRLGEMMTIGTTGDGCQKIPIQSKKRPRRAVFDVLLTT